MIHFVVALTVAILAKQFTPSEQHRSSSWPCQRDGFLGIGFILIVPVH